MRKVLLVALLVLAFASVAMADATVTLTWTAPTVNCDGSNLDDLAGYSILWWFQGTPETVVEQDVGLVTTTSITLIGTVEGRTVVFAAASYDTNGNRSDDADGCGLSNVVSIPFPPTYPSPPTGLGVAVP